MYIESFGYNENGEVVEATEKDIKKMLKDIGTTKNSKFCCESEFDEFADNLKIKKWTPTYPYKSHDKYWVSYADEIKENMRNYRYENFDIYDSDEDIVCNDKLDSFIECLMLKIYNNCSIQDYLPFVIEKVEKLNEDNILLFSKTYYLIEDGEKYLPIVKELKEKITSLTGEKLISIVYSEGLVTTKIDEYGLYENGVTATESFYSFLISLLSRESFEMTISQIIGNDGENNIHTIYELKFSKGEIEYISSSGMKI